MANQYISVDTGQLSEFFGAMSQAGDDAHKEMVKFLEGLGTEFLRVVSDEIIRRNALDSRLLLNSMSQGAAENVWEINDGDLTLEVGTNVEYASYVNDGHWTNPKGVERRFVPGYWAGERFVYAPGSKTGMVLTQKWVPGKHYWESAIRIMDRMMPELLDAKLQQWIDEYFGRWG